MAPKYFVSHVVSYESGPTFGYSSVVISWMDGDKLNNFNHRFYGFWSQAHSNQDAVSLMRGSPASLDYEHDLTLKLRNATMLIKYNMWEISQEEYDLLEEQVAPQVESEISIEKGNLNVYKLFEYNCKSRVLDLLKSINIDTRSMENLFIPIPLFSGPMEKINANDFWNPTEVTILPRTPISRLPQKKDSVDAVVQELKETLHILKKYLSDKNLESEKIDTFIGSLQKLEPEANKNINQIEVLVQTIRAEIKANEQDYPKNAIADLLFSILDRFNVRIKKLRQYASPTVQLDAHLSKLKNAKISANKSKPKPKSKPKS